MSCHHSCRSTWHDGVCMYICMCVYVYIHNITPKKCFKRHHFVAMPLILFRVTALHLQSLWIYAMEKTALSIATFFFLPENYLQDGVLQTLFQNTDTWIHQLKEKINTDDHCCMLCLSHQKFSLRFLYANLFPLILSSLCSKIVSPFIMLTCSFAVGGVHS